MWRMLQQDQADDFVIATGESFELREFIEVAFSTLGIDWQDHVVIDPSLARKTDILSSCAHPAKAIAVLDWKATYKMPDVARMMVEAELQMAKTAQPGGSARN